MIYGKHSVFEALHSFPDRVEIIYYHAQSGNEISDIINKAEKAKIQCRKLQSNEFQSRLSSLFSQPVNHQNILAKVKPYQFCDFKDEVKKLGEKSLIVALDHITDVANFGAIIRSCVAFDVDMIVIPKDRSVSVNATVVKTSAGMAMKAKIAQVPNLANVFNTLKDQGFWIYAADGQSSTEISKVDFPNKTILLVGSEGKGIGPRLMKLVDSSFNIPISNNVESLNVSVATAISLYHIQFLTTSRGLS